MFVLSHITTFVAHHRPSIAQCIGIGRGSGNKSLDCYNRMLSETLVIVRVAIIGYFMWRLVQLASHSVPCQVFYHTETALLGFCFHQMSEVCNLYSAFDECNGFFQYLF